MGRARAPGPLRPRPARFVAAVTWPAGPPPRIARSFYFSPVSTGASHDSQLRSPRQRRRDHPEQPAGQRPGLRHARAASPTAWTRPTPMPAVKAIVITGAGKAFSGGADIREFGSPKAIAEPNLLSLIAAVRGLGQADRGGDAQRRHGRRAGTGAGLPLPRGRARHAGGAARGQARPGARRRRHAAPAARAGRGDRAEHDRQRRAGEERDAGRACRARSCSTS